MGLMARTHVLEHTFENQSSLFFLALPCFENAQINSSVNCESLELCLSGGMVERVDYLTFKTLCDHFVKQGSEKWEN